VGLDAIPLVAAKTGVGHYTDALADALARVYREHQYTLLSPFDFSFEVNGHGNGSSRPANLVKQFLPVRSIFRHWWLVGLPALLRISPFDVFHGTNYCIPVFAPCPTVVTIHDLSLFTQAHTHEDANVKRGKRRIPVMAHRATLIIAPSEWTRREITQHLKIKDHKLRVIPEAARPHMRPQREDEVQPVLEKHGIRGPFLLYVGTIEPRKNLLTLIRAYDDLIRSTEHRPQLVLAGGRGWLFDEVFNLVEELRLQDQVKFTGYVADADLPALYSAAEAFVYPSLYEGFGLPPLEAMACGAPVITSNVTSLPEVVGTAGLTHAPEDARALSQAMVKLLNDIQMREHFKRAGLERAQQFSWERAARATQAVYDEVFNYWQRKRW
jgi:glycosyltransferase involved in cell wall biosynthesis